MLFASPLAAQDINWQLDRINPGFAVQLAYDPGGTYTHRLRGIRGGHAGEGLLGGALDLRIGAAAHGAFAVMGDVLPLQPGCSA
jgi:hypothetical protein